MTLAVHCCIGGMNTAGLGGVGGPYRLDAGNDVYQVSDFDKSQVPEEVSIVVRCRYSGITFRLNQVFKVLFETKA